MPCILRLASWLLPFREVHDDGDHVRSGVCYHAHAKRVIREMWAGLDSCREEKLSGPF